MPRLTGPVDRLEYPHDSGTFPRGKIGGLVMSDCNSCGKFILFGGRKLDGYQYCGSACANSHSLLRAAERVPQDAIQQLVEQWRNGPCPRCKRQAGAVDVYVWHRVHSLVLYTQWSTIRSVCCRRCGRRDQVVGVLYCTALGWWGFPWGILVTPVQIVRNLAAICRRPPARASTEFERVVRRQLAQRQWQIEGEIESFSAQR